MLPAGVELDQLLFIAGKLAGQLLAQALGLGQSGAGTVQFGGDRRQILLCLLLAGLFLLLPLFIGKGQLGAEGEGDQKGEPFHD
ncbi:hypothetical protein D3C85_548040 [compost metagenome]